jgi:hypothetical protein
MKDGKVLSFFIVVYLNMLKFFIQCFAERTSVGLAKYSDAGSPVTPHLHTIDVVRYVWRPVRNSCLQKVGGMVIRQDKAARRSISSSIIRISSEHQNSHPILI